MNEVKYALEKYCRDMCIKVKVLDEDIMQKCFPNAEAAINHRKMIIYVKENDGGLESSYILLHELGHALDLKNNPEKESVPIEFWNYIKAAEQYGILIPQEVIDNMMEMEHTAFNNGRVIADTLGITLDESLWLSLMNTCLESHNRLVAGEVIEHVS